MIKLSKVHQDEIDNHFSIKNQQIRSTVLAQAQNNMNEIHASA